MPGDDPRSPDVAAYSPVPILLLGHLGRSWDCENGVVWDCENRFEATGNGGRDCWSDPGSVIDDEIAISHATKLASAAIYSTLRVSVEVVLWSVLASCIQSRRRREQAKVHILNQVGPSLKRQKPEFKGRLARR